MTDLFATKIPLEANFLDIIRAIEQVGKVQHITILPQKDEKPGKKPKEFQSAFLQYETEEEANEVLEKVGAHRGKLLSEQMMNENIVKVCDEPIVIEQYIDKKIILDRIEKKDKRHLNLLYEGHITPDDAAAKGVPPEDMKKRKKLFDEMQKKLADVNNSIVPTRLCIMNVPDGVDTQRIRKIFAVASNRYSRNHKKFPECQAAMKSPPRITEVRKIESQRGLFFVEFTKHEHALCALRQTNNNPEYFDGIRMIVQFAIANSFATRDRKKKLEARKKEKIEQMKRREERSKEQYGFEPTRDSDEDEGEDEE